MLTRNGPRFHGAKLCGETTFSHILHCTRETFVIRDATRMTLGPTFFFFFLRQAENDSREFQFR